MTDPASVAAEEARFDEIMRRMSSDNPRSRQHDERTTDRRQMWRCMPIEDAVVAREALLLAARSRPAGELDVEADPIECAICGDYSAAGVEVHESCLELLSRTASSTTTEAGEGWRARKKPDDPFPVPTVPELDDILRKSLPADVVYAIAPHGDPFTRWARAMLEAGAAVRPVEREDAAEPEKEKQ